MPRFCEASRIEYLKMFGSYAYCSGYGKRNPNPPTEPFVRQTTAAPEGSRASNQVPTSSTAQAGSSAIPSVTEQVRQIGFKVYPSVKHHAGSKALSSRASSTPHPKQASNQSRLTAVYYDIELLTQYQACIQDEIYILRTNTTSLQSTHGGEELYTRMNR